MRPTDFWQRGRSFDDLPLMEIPLEDLREPVGWHSTGQVRMNRVAVVAVPRTLAKRDVDRIAAVLSALVREDV